MDYSEGSLYTSLHLRKQEYRSLSTMQDHILVDIQLHPQLVVGPFKYRALDTNVCMPYFFLLYHNCILLKFIAGRKRADPRKIS